MGLETIEPTTDPETDNYPHYYEAAKPRGYIYSALVYADPEPVDADCLASVGLAGESIAIDIEYETNDVKIGVGTSLAPEDARLLARSLTMLANRIDPVEP